MDWLSDGQFERVYSEFVHFASDLLSDMIREPETLQLLVESLRLSAAVVVVNSIVIGAEVDRHEVK